MDFVSNTAEQQKEMLKSIGIPSIDGLFKDIPRKIFLKEKLKLEKGLSEQEVREQVSSLSARNASAAEYRCFLGAGVYHHFIPAAVWALAGRSEFLTSYTPYQPETSQGMLQCIFEWQTFICELTGMDATNASTYDGAEATAEAVLMARNITKKNKILIARTLNPQYRQVAETYAKANSLELVEIGWENGVLSLKELEKHLDERVAGVIVQCPNFFGCLEPLAAIEKRVHAQQAVLVVAISEVLSTALLKSAGSFNADIVVGDVQSFGIPMSFGGPHAGFIAVKEKNVRHLPGRIVGETVDAVGKKGYIMTLQAREQHIRREKAASNLCTNQALMALAATVYMALLGKNGLSGLAELNAQRAHYAFEQMGKILGIQKVFSAPFFNEFVVKVKGAKKIQRKLLQKKILWGLALEEVFPELKDHLLVTVTEMNSKKQMDELVQELKKVVG